VYKKGRDGWNPSTRNTRQIKALEGNPSAGLRTLCGPAPPLELHGLILGLVHLGKH